MNNKRKRIILAVLLVVAFVAILAPTLYIAQYNQPSEDDFAYGAYASKIYDETQSVARTIIAAIRSARDTYMSWQGTFSGVVAMCLGPYVFNIAWYDASTYILLGVLIAATSFIMYKLLVSVLGVDIATYVITTIVILIVTIELVPFPKHSFFWYNGSILYTLFYSIGLCVYGLTIGLIQYSGKRIWPRYLLIVPLVLIVGTGNFVASLNQTIVISFVMLYMVITKNKKYKRILPVLIAALIALLIVCLAPGNLNRQSHHTGISEIAAVIKSFAFGLQLLFKQHVYSYNKVLAIVAILALVPLMHKYIAKVDFDFKRPWLLAIISFCTLCAMFTPPVYVFGTVNNVSRVVNVIYFTYVMLLFINIVYFYGYISKKFTKHHTKLIESIPAMHNRLFLCSFYVALVVISLFSISKVDPTINKTLPMSLRSVKVIANGTGKIYDNEYQKRLEALLSDEKDIVLPAYSCQPDMLFFSDMNENPDTWPNDRVARFFNKDSVIVVDETQ